jgi:hypothetical protein
MSWAPHCLDDSFNSATITFLGVIRVRRIAVFLMIAALVVVMTGCVVGIPGFTLQYSITISSTMGGAVTSPGEGLFRYAEGTVVNLVAEPDRGYEFLCWTTNAGTIADIWRGNMVVE